MTNYYYIIYKKVKILSKFIEIIIIIKNKQMKEMKQDFISDKNLLVKQIRKELKRQNKVSTNKYDLYCVGEFIGEFVSKYENKINNYFETFLQTFTNDELQIVDYYNDSNKTLKQVLQLYRQHVVC